MTKGWKVVVWTMLCTVLAVPGAFAFPTGPPNLYSWCGNQGSQSVCQGGNCNNCTACHFTFSPPNSGSGSVEIANLPTSYEPGVQYALAVFLDDATNPDFAIAGFELASLAANGLCQAGDLTPDAPDTRVDLDGGTGTQWLKHSNPQNAQAGTAMWQFLWTAPPDDTLGDIAFSVCANAANDGDGAEGDRIYCTEVTVPLAAAPVEEPTLRVALTPQDLDLNWVGQAPAFNLYRGPLEEVGAITTTTGAYEQVACGVAANTAPDPTPLLGSGQSTFYLVVPSTGSGEGTYGCADFEATGTCGPDRTASVNPCP